MRFVKPGKNKSVCLLLLLFFLNSCSPPDVPACTAFPALRWPEMRNLFYKLCGDDPSCNPVLDEWKKDIDQWSDPTDGGWCIKVRSQESFEIGPLNPSPWKGKDGKPKAWKDIYSGGVTFPAKEGWAPLKTWIQTTCRKNDSRCKDGVGNWESTVNQIDRRVLK